MFSCPGAGQSQPAVARLNIVRQCGLVWLGIEALGRSAAASEVKESIVLQMITFWRILVLQYVITGY
jgi:hypothetical protein